MSQISQTVTWKTDLVPSVIIDFFPSQSEVDLIKYLLLILALLSQILVQGNLACFNTVSCILKVHEVTFDVFLYKDVDGIQSPRLQSVFANYHVMMCYLVCLECRYTCTLRTDNVTHCLFGKINIKAWTTYLLNNLSLKPGSKLIKMNAMLTGTGPVLFFYSFLSQSCQRLKDHVVQLQQCQLWFRLVLQHTKVSQMIQTLKAIFSSAPGQNSYWWSSRLFRLL